MKVIRRKTHRIFSIWPASIRCIVLLCCLIVATRGGWAQTRESAKRVTLPNGVRLILKPETGSDVIAIVIFVRMERDRSSSEAMLGEIVARALFFGSQNRSADRIAQAVWQVGGALETLRTPDYVAVTCVTVSSAIHEAIYLLCEALKNADFAPDALARAQLLWEEERQKRQADGFEMGSAALNARLSGVPEPDVSALRRIKQDAAWDYFHNHYVPARTIIAVVGRFDAEEARRAFDNDLFDYDRAAPQSASTAKTAELSEIKEQSVTFKGTGNVAYAFVGAASPGVANPDYPAYTVLQTLLGGGHAARLFRRIRDAQGIGYEVGASYRADRAEPLITYIQWDASRDAAAPTRDKAVPQLNAQLDSVLTDPPSEAEIARARNVAVGRDALRHERARDRAFLLGWYEAMGLGYGFDTEFPRRLTAVTREDVLRVARTYLNMRSSALLLPDHSELANHK